MLRRSLIAALTLAAIVLTGCTDTTRIPPADPTPTDAPLFSSDEEALAAATEVYEEYLAAATEASESGGESVARLSRTSTNAFFEREIASLQEFQSDGSTVSGEPSLRSMTLQQRYVAEEFSEVVVTYVCLDVSEVRILDPNGDDVTSPDRSAFTSLEVEFVAQPDSPTLLINRSEAWRGESQCQ